MNTRLIRVRFAPSPTGNLHVGGARMAIFNWLFAKANKGLFLLRIEDTDTVRSTKEFQKAIISSLAWLGIESDEEIVIQTENADFHSQVAQDFLNRKVAYKCFCSKEELGLMRDSSEDEAFKYPRTCRSLSDADIERLGAKPYVIRFALPLDVPDRLSFVDVIKGEISVESSILDDFVIVKNDGIATYNFAVVVDDITMGISHIIRGEEHIINTFRQQFLYMAMGKPMPMFGHTPMILGANGEKLSKRHGATSVEDYKNDGYLPEAMFNYLVRLGWSYGDQEIFSIAELCDIFKLEDIGVKNGIFDPDKLKWLNTVYLKKLTYAQFLEHLAGIKLDQYRFLNNASRQIQAEQLFRIFVPRVVTVVELATQIIAAFNFSENFSRTNAMFLDPVRSALLKSFLLEVEHEQLITSKQLHDFAKDFARRKDVKMSELAKSLRFVIIGDYEGPSAFELAVVFGPGHLKKVLSNL